MQTIPDAVLDQIIKHRPHLATMIANLRADPAHAERYEIPIAQNYLAGETHLSAKETWYLAQVAYGGPWGGEWARSWEVAAILGVDESRVRQRIAAGELPHITRGKTHYVRRNAIRRK